MIKTIKPAKYKVFFIVLFIVLLKFESFSQTFYFRASSTPTNNSWINPLCWVTNPVDNYGGASSGVAPNNPLHNVIFDDFSDNNASLPVPVSINYPSSGILSIGNIAFTCSNTTTNAISFNGGGLTSSIFRVYGNLIFANSTCPNLTTFTPRFEFRTAVIGSINTIDTKGVSFPCLTYFTSSNCTFSVISNFISQANTVYIGDNPTSSFPNVIFNQDYISLGNTTSFGLYLAEGNLTMLGNVSGGLSGTASEWFTTNPVSSFTAGCGTLYFGSDASAINIPTITLTTGKRYNSNKILFGNVIASAIGGEINCIDFGIKSDKSASQYDFTNSTTNVSVNFQIVVNTPALPGNLIFTNNTINLDKDRSLSPNSFFSGGGCSINKVFVKKVSRFGSDYTSTSAANATSYNELRFYAGCAFTSIGNYVGPVATVINNPSTYIKINPLGLLQFNGGYYTSESGIYTLKVASTGTLDLNGGCSKPNYFYRGNCDLTTCIVMGDYNRMDIFNVLSGFNKNCGSSSYKTPGTSTVGWFINPALTLPLSLPIKRTLYWAGAKPTGNTTIYSYTVLTTTSYDNYGRWDKSENWSTIPTDGPGLNTSGGECPPTLIDSVIMKDESYVRLVESYSEVGDLKWLGKGILTDTNYISRTNRNLAIFGSLYFFDTQTNYGYYQNRFRGTIQFRAFKPYCQIKSSNNPFNYVILFTSPVATSTAGVWTLVDSLTVLPKINFLTGVLPEQSARPREGIIMFRNGTLLTNNQNINCEQFQFSNISILNLGSSNFFIHYPYSVTGFDDKSFSPFFNSSTNIPNATTGPWISAGTSTIHILSKLDPIYGINSNYEDYFSGIYNHTGFSSPGGYTYYDVVFHSPNPKMFAATISGRTDNFHSVEFKQSGNIVQSATNTAVNIGTLTTNTNFSVSVPFIMTLDTLKNGNSINIGYAHFYENTDFKTPVTYTNTLRYEPGATYKIYHPTNYVQTLASTATMIAQGTCSKMITITNGNYINQNLSTQNCNNLIINNNNANGGGGFNYGNGNSVTTGTVIGWTGTTRPPKTYYWVDNSPGITKFSWFDCTHWASTSGGTTGAIGVPSSVDDVVFDINSFTNNNDTVEIDPQIFANCKNMSFTNSNFKGVLKGKDSTCMLNIYGSLTLNTNSDNKFFGEIKFLCSTPTTNSITSANNKFNWKLNFDGNPNSTWVLQDKLETFQKQWGSTSANRFYKTSLDFKQGILITNNQTIITEIFYSNGSLPRQLAAGTSSINIFGNNLNFSSGVGPYQIGINKAVWEVTGGNYTIMAVNSKLEFSSQKLGLLTANGPWLTNRIVLGKDQRYGKITTTYTNSSYSIDGYRDTIGIINSNSREFWIGSFPSSGSVNLALEGVEIPSANTNYASGYNNNSGISRLKIGTLNYNYLLTTPVPALGINSYYNEIDTALFNNNVSVFSDNKYYDLLYFKPAYSQVFKSSTVQWIQNGCEFKPIGTAANNINFNSTATGVQAYFRKDSSIVCTNYINIRDIHVIGNGGHYSNTYSTSGGSLIPGNSYTTNPLAVIANADCFGNYGNPLVDTTLSCGVSSYSTALGHGSTYWPIYTTTSGRADFQAGTFAVPNSYASQSSLNVRGWSYNPTSVAPQASVNAASQTICEGDSVPISFNIIGFPLQSVTYSTSVDGGISKTGIDSLPALNQFHPLTGNGVSPTPFVWTFWVKPTVTTIYYAGDAAINQCFSNVGIGIGQVTITVNPAPTSIAPVNNQICSGQTFTLQGSTNPAISTNWFASPTSTTSINTSANTYVNNITSVGNYTYYAVTTQTLTGCKSLIKTPVLVTVNSIPTITLSAVSGQTVCSGTPVTIILSGATSYTVINSGVFGSGNFTVNPTGNITYSIVGSNSANCPSTNMATTTVLVPPAIISALNATIQANCGIPNGQATINVTGGSPAYTYSWSASAPGITFTTSVPFTHSLAAGINTLTVIDVIGCKINTLISIPELNTLSANITSSILPYCENSNGSIVVIASGGTPAYNFVWSTGATTNSLTDVGAASYTFTLTDAFGCKATFSTILECKNDLIVPQIFSPNGDGKNDVFEIKGIEVFPNNQVNIFNRWGSLIYSKKGYNNEWNGSANVKDAFGTGKLPSGTYFVVIDFGDNLTKSYNGYIELRY